MTTDIVERLRGAGGVMPRVQCCPECRCRPALRSREPCGSCGAVHEVGQNTLCDDSTPQDVTKEPWASIKHLLDSFPGSIRCRYKGGDEDLLGSLCTTFIALRDAAMVKR